MLNILNENQKRIERLNAILKDAKTILDGALTREEHSTALSTLKFIKELEDEIERLSEFLP